MMMMMMKKKKKTKGKRTETRELDGEGEMATNEANAFFASAHEAATSPPPLQRRRPPPPLHIYDYHHGLQVKQSACPTQCAHTLPLAIISSE